MTTQPQRLIGESAALTDMLDKTSLVAPLNRPVLVIGERGTGKELVAERIHFLSPRWDQAFLKVNCGAISETLLDADLFGYEPGAFTGATRVHRGRFERADGGTLFLDELANTSAMLQEKLLRIIEYGEFERLGSQTTRQVNVRIIGATNENLPAMVAQNRFRADLLDRLAFDVITLPPLRARDDDIVLLAEHFALRMSAELGWESFPGFSNSVIKQLKQHPFYGNVRELKNTVERSLYRWADAGKAIDELILDPFESAFTPANTTPQKTSDTWPVKFTDAMDDSAKQLLKRALQETNQHQGKAAELLGLSYHQFRHHLRKQGML